MALSDLRHKFSTREVTMDNILHAGVIKPVKNMFLLEMSNNVCQRKKSAVAHLGYLEIYMCNSYPVYCFQQQTSSTRKIKKIVIKKIVIMSIEMYKLKFLYHTLKACPHLLDSQPFLYIIYMYFLGVFSPAKWNLSPLTVHITGERCDVCTDFLLLFQLLTEMLYFLFSKI